MRILSFLAVAAAMMGMLTGCMFKDLNRDLEEYDASFALTGKVSTPSGDSEKVIVILFSQENGEQIPVRYVFPENTGHFSFLVKSGVYYLKAFEDLNENLAHDPGECAGAFPDPIRIAPLASSAVGKTERARKNLDMRLAPADNFIDGMENINDLTIEQMPVFKLGTIAKLDDPLFDPANGSTGYWKPLSFIRQFGVGIYFLEPYDPARIPVLFVHGATGTPAGWKDMADGLDRHLFQPWFYYYPSGIRLDVAAKILNELIETLHDKYGFDRLCITAHSMGGLVSRAAILAQQHQAEETYIKLFVSLSTPWGGVQMAKKGVENAPTAIPSWHDVSPGSEFLQSIYDRSLSPVVPFHLLFSFKGNCSMFMENNDGTVELDSELDYRAQADAAGIYGFNEDHGSILSSRDVIEKYRTILKTMQYP